MPDAKKKDSVSINVCAGDELFGALERLCALTGQSKTVAVERAIRMFCTPPAPATGKDGEP